MMFDTPSLGPALGKSMLKPLLQSMLLLLKHTASSGSKRHHEAQHRTCSVCTLARNVPLSVQPILPLQDALYAVPVDAVKKAYAAWQTACPELLLAQMWSFSCCC